MVNKKYYVVWKGLNPGVYDNWNDCRIQVEAYENAKYKSFPSREEAESAYDEGFTSYLHRTSVPKTYPRPWEKRSGSRPILDSLSVDAACSGNPGDMEYRGVVTGSGQELFHIGPLELGTNNVGEFLALVHGLAFLKQQGSRLPVYSDSVNAIKWVTKKKCKTLLERQPVNEPIFKLIERAEKWLQLNTYTTTILKWDTSQWGEIPADFGRK